MSYCRFENTCTDFQDCVDAFQSSSLEELSSSERVYAERLYELAKSYVGMFGMELQANEEDSEGTNIPTSEQEKNLFLQYYKVQMKGDYNMITDQEKAAEACGLSLNTYQYIQSNYNTFYRMFEAECKVIDDMIMEEIRSCE